MEWNYTDINAPDNWHQKYASVVGAKQSPIDIQPEKYKIASTVSKQKFKVHYNSKGMSVIRNTGHSWQISDDTGTSEITGGPLSRCTYVLAQIHAHWGYDDTEGSEHTINGQHYSAELHLVHWNKTNYPSLTEATKHPDGLCVLAVMLKKGQANPEIQKIVQRIPHILHKGDSCKCDDLIIPKTLLPNTFNYWTYMGSLTTPPCLECVIWIVFDEPVEVSHEQLEAFRTLRCHKADGCDSASCEDQMRRNNRPTVPLGDRLILRNGAISTELYKHL